MCKWVYDSSLVYLFKCRSNYINAKDFSVQLFCHGCESYAFSACINLSTNCALLHILILNIHHLDGEKGGSVVAFLFLFEKIEYKSYSDNTSKQAQTNQTIERKIISDGDGRAVARSSSPCFVRTQALVFKFYVRQSIRAVITGLTVISVKPSIPGVRCR